MKKSTIYDKLSLNGLKHNINLSFIGLNRNYDMTFDISQITKQSLIDTLTFNNVNLELLNQPVGFTEIKIKKLIFTNNTKVNYDHFKNINLNKIIVEYASIEMFSKFQNLYENKPKDNKDEIIIESKDIESIDITNSDIMYNNETKISYANKICLKVESNFTLNVNENTTDKVGKINFEFTHERGIPEIDIPNKVFNKNFSFGVTINNNEAKLKFNTNALPVEIKGSGQLELSTPSYHEMIVKKPITIHGDLSIIVPNSYYSINVPNISVKYRENIFKDSISVVNKGSIRRSLLSDIFSTVYISIQNLELESNTKTEISNFNINNLLKIGNEAEVIFSGNATISCPIIIQYGARTNPSFETFITFETMLDMFYPTYIMLQSIGPNTMEHFNIIKSSENEFSMLKCKHLLSLVSYDSPNMTIKCLNNNGIVTLEAFKLSSNEPEKSGSGIGLIIIGIVVGFIILAVITVIVIVIIISIIKKRRNIECESQEKYNYEIDEIDLDAI